MKRSGLVVVLAVALLAPGPVDEGLPQTGWPGVAAAGPLQPVFEPNLGQLPDDVRFVARAGPGTLGLLTDAGVRLAVDGHEVELAVEAGAPSEVVGEQRLPGEVNYLLGDDPDRWVTRIPTFEQVRYRDVLDGIDLVFHAERGRLKYDLVVSPGADVLAARIRVTGADRLRPDGETLVIETPNGPLTVQRPLTYQLIDRRRVEVPAHFEVVEHDTYRVVVGAHDPTVPLVVDPVLDWVTYLGGSGRDSVTDVAVDAQGNGYLVGRTTSADLPSRNSLTGGYQGEECDDSPPCPDGFVAKLRSDGRTLAYLTYLGGRRRDNPYGVAVDDAGSAYVTGSTSSPDFPTLDAMQDQWRAHTDAFLAKLSPDGSTLVYSTYLGGGSRDYAIDIALGSDGAVYLTGATESQDWPTTPGAYQESCPPTQSLSCYTMAFVTKLAPSGRALEYSTYLGGPGEGGGIAGWDVGRSIAVDEDGSVVVAGGTSSDDFPVTAGAYQQRRHGFSEAFVTRLDPDGADLVWSTYLGGEYREQAEAVALHPSGVYVVGTTQSPDFPTTSGALATECGYRYCHAFSDAFVTKLRPDGSSLVYSTYLPGSFTEEARDVAVDRDGHAYVVGLTYAHNFPIRNAFHNLPQPWLSRCAGQIKLPCYDAFIIKLDRTGSEPIFSSLLVGRRGDIANAVALAPDGSVWIAGETHSSNLPAAGFQTRILGEPFEHGSYPSSGFAARISGPDDAGTAGVNRRTAAAEDPVLAAVRISQDTFPDGTARLALLGRDDVFADSLAGAGLARGDGPLLYTTSGTDAPLRPETRQELQRALGKPAGCDHPQVLVLGGTAAVSERAQREVLALGYCTQRYGGRNRIDTALLIAPDIDEDEDLPRSAPVLLARADDWADAAAAGAVSARRGIPLLLTGRDVLDPAVAAYLEGRHGPTILLGGAAALSYEVEYEVSRRGQTRRLAGAARDGTAAEIAEKLWYESDRQGVTLLNGYTDTGWAYALAAAAPAARQGGPLLFALPDELAPDTAAYLRRHPYRFVIAAGPPTLLSSELVEGTYSGTTSDW